VAAFHDAILLNAALALLAMFAVLRVKDSDAAASMGKPDDANDHAN
jgi:hypothetical protein